MNTKTSAHYQREYRRRLREQGLVKKEVWIRPEHAKALAMIEKRLRIEVKEPVMGEELMSEVSSYWSTESLYQALQSVPIVQQKEIVLNLLEGVEPVLSLEMRSFGDLPLFLTVAGEQILIEAWLWPYDQVRSAVEFNELILRTHKLFPLSTLSLDTVESGESYYTLFGALSSQSKLESILIEVETLARNVMQVTQAYAPYLKEAAS
ncbi:MAG: YjfI family protein [Reinekea sp.]